MDFREVLWYTLFELRIVSLEGSNLGNEKPKAKPRELNTESGQYHTIVVPNNRSQYLCIIRLP